MKRFSYSTIARVFNAILVLRGISVLAFQHSGFRHGRVFSGRSIRSTEQNNFLLSMISSSSVSNIPTGGLNDTLSKYPTQRGTTVDSREIVAQGAGKKYLTAVRLSHILFQSEELASISLNRLRAGDISFDDLAKQISNCDETREHGGHIGWASCSEGDGTNEHLDGFFPAEARIEAMDLSTKV